MRSSCENAGIEYRISGKITPTRYRLRFRFIDAVYAYVNSWSNFICYQRRYLDVKVGNLHVEI
jgi:hypothetical protein